MQHSRGGRKPKMILCRLPPASYCYHKPAGKTPVTQSHPFKYLFSIPSAELDTRMNTSQALSDKKTEDAAEEILLAFETCCNLHRTGRFTGSNYEGLHSPPVTTFCSACTHRCAIPFSLPPAAALEKALPLVSCCW